MCRWSMELVLGLVLVDLDERPIQAMDSAGIDVQVLTLNPPGVEQLDAGEAVVFASLTRFISAHY